MKIVVLFQEKNRLLKAFLSATQDYQRRFKEETNLEVKMDWVDELSDLREQNVKTLQLIDHEIETEHKTLNKETIEKLQGQDFFRTTLEETLQLIKEIQLTDQSLFLYIQTMGFELRTQILKGLKEKEAMSKFKSQTQGSTGEGLDQTV